MFARLLYQSFLRQRRRKLLAGLAVALGVGVATAMIAVATDIGDKINLELRSYGANIVVYPQDDALQVEVGGVNLKPASDAAYLNEADLPKIKQTFWHNNIVGFAPMLPVPAQVTTPKSSEAVPAELVGTYFAKSLRVGKVEFTTGVRKTHPWWSVAGAWPRDDAPEVLVGASLAGKLKVSAGDELRVSGLPVKVAGIVTADEATNQQMVGPLALAQQIAGKPGAVRRVFISALTKPEDELARRDPRSLSPAMYDRWYCSPYANSIAYQTEEAIPRSRAEQIRQVAQNEGTVLSRIAGLMLLLAAAALVAAALAVSAAMATAIFERRGEIGLMKALGAGKASVAMLFMAEAAVLAIIAGAAGLALGTVLAAQMGAVIFNARIVVQPALLPIVLAIAMVVTFAGSAASIRRAVKLQPATVLRGDA